MIHIRSRRRRKGFLMILSLFALTSALALTMVGLTRSVNELTVANRFVASQQSFALSEAGLDVGVHCLKWFGSQALSPQCAGSTPTCVFDLNQTALGAECTLPAAIRSNGAISVLLDPADDNLTAHIKRYTIRATSSVNGVTDVRTVRYTWRLESFAKFGYFSNAETTEAGQRGYWVTGNVFQGPFHTNGQLNLYGTPVFEGKTSSVSPTLNCPWGCTPDFQQGIQKPAPVIPLNALSINEVYNSATVRITGDAAIELQGASILVTTASGTTSYAVNDYPVVFVEGGNLTMAGGELDGQMTIATDGDILVANHVRYHCDAEDPTDDVDCLDPSTGQVKYNNDFLGLVAKKNVRVVTSAPNNLVIQSSVMAVEGALKVDNYNDTTRGPRGTLHVFGGVSMKFGGFTGMFNGSGQMVSGYEEHHSYDDRFQSSSPPGFPTTGRYEAACWEDWRPGTPSRCP